MCMSENCNAERDLKLMAKDIGEIKSALLGNPFTNNKGLIHTVIDNTEEIQKIKKGINYRSGFSAGIGASIGLGLGLLFKHLFGG